MRHMPNAGALTQQPTTIAHLDAEVRETHTGIVFLVGDLAYKVKKQVHTDFLDFLDVDAREKVCAHEVLLNSRLAPDSYLGMGHFASPRGGVDEPVIVMRRYPADRSLAALVKAGAAAGPQLSTIADVLAAFHRRATRSAAVDAAGRSAVVSELWTENLDVLNGFADSVLPTWMLADVRRLALRYLAGRAPLFAERIAGGRLVDGHGDLLADDVFCMDDGPKLLDCLEFDDRLRHVDGIDDAAFLAMDLEFLGRADLARDFLTAYRQAAADCAPESLVHFYIAYRAVVRAKVDCIRFGQGVPAAREDARRHLQIALEHLRVATVRLVLVGGGPGSGKSTLARALAPAVGAVVISTDDVRQELVASGDLVGGGGSFAAGRYAPHQVDAVYDAVLQYAASHLAHGRSVILDGTWRDAGHRRKARELGDRNSCPTVELACTVDVDQALERIRSRRPGSSSEVTPAVAEELYRTAPEWPDANRINTTQPLGDSVAEATAICCLAV
jgi:aminoglycoside phosphotransferase family enzyme/predicted kinase